LIKAPQGVLGSTTEKYNPWRTALIFTAVVVLAAVVVGIIIIATKSSPGRTYPAGSVGNLPVAEGPSLSYMKKTTLKDFNKEEALSGTQSACTYVPKDWKPGYVLTCFIYNSSGSGLGTVVVTSTSAAAANSQTWNEEFSKS